MLFDVLSYYSNNLLFLRSKHMEFAGFSIEIHLAYSYNCQNPNWNIELIQSLNHYTTEKDNVL